MWFQDKKKYLFVMTLYPYILIRPYFVFVLANMLFVYYNNGDDTRMHLNTSLPTEIPPS